MGSAVEKDGFFFGFFGGSVAVATAGSGGGLVSWG